MVNVGIFRYMHGQVWIACVEQENLLVWTTMSAQGQATVTFCCIRLLESLNILIIAKFLVFTVLSESHVVNVSH